MDPPRWLIEQAIEPEAPADRDALHAALGELAAKDPNFTFVTDRTSGAITMRGLTDFHLDLTVAALPLAAITQVPRVATVVANGVEFEPIMHVEVTITEEFIGDVIGDLNSRGGEILGTEERDGMQAVTALVPVANLFGYLSAVRAFTDDAPVSFSMRFGHNREARPPTPPDDTFPPAVGMRA